MNLETEHLIFRQLEDDSDAAKCHENFWSSYETSKYMLWRPTNNVEEAKERMNKWIDYAKAGNLLWFIYDKEINEPIGFISVERKSETRFGSVGLGFGEKFTKRGYGYEAMKKLIEYIKTLGAKEIEYSCFEDNVGSQKLAEKLGFSYFKTDKRIRKYDNKEFVELFFEGKI